MKIIGPFSQILTLDNMPLRGPLNDGQLQVIADGGVLVQGDAIVAVAGFNRLRQDYRQASVEEIMQPAVLLPGFVDCHTHICFGGSRAMDYAMRNAGHSYLDIARAGGGIWSTVQMTRAATGEMLLASLLARISRHVAEGVTTIEIKSGYGLSLDEELKMLRVISNALAYTPATLVSTCLAAHIKPRDFEGSPHEYLAMLVQGLLPALKNENLANRVDIFTEETAFSVPESRWYLQQAKSLGFDITIHADQFSTGGSALAVEMGAASADHLEASGQAEIQALAQSHTVAVVLPGASLGLGMHYAPARKLLDAGACVAIASDWNPGSAPMGDLLMQASVLAAAEKLTTAETFAGLTSRAAAALHLYDRGSIAPGKKAHFQAYACADFREILYHQGKMKPVQVWC